jgi:zinc protease
LKRRFIASLCLLLLAALLLPAQQPATPSAPQAPVTKQAPAKTPAKTPAKIPAKAAAPEAVEVPWTTETLSNSLEVIIFPDRSVPLVTVDLAIKMGSFVEGDDTNGYSHFFEHLFFRENEAIARGEDYLQDIGRKGIVYNGETREEVTHFYLTSPSAHFEILLRFLRDAAMYPSFNSAQFEREREVVIEEILRQDANPYSALERETHRRMFPGQQARKLPGGTQRSLRAASIERLREWHRRYFAPDNAALVITGDVDRDHALRRVSALFGSWQRAAGSLPPSPPVDFPPLAESSAGIVEAPIQNVIIRFEWHGPSVGRDTPATHAADVFSNIVRQPNSLFQRALVDTGLVNVVGVNYYTQRFTGPISILAVTSPEKARAALKAIAAEVRRFAAPDYYTDEELENAKASLAAEDLFDQEKLSEYAHTLAFWWASGGTDYFRDYQRDLRRVTRADIRRYLTAYIVGKPNVVVVLLSSPAQRQLKLQPEELLRP